MDAWLGRNSSTSTIQKFEKDTWVEQVFAYNDYTHNKKLWRQYLNFGVVPPKYAPLPCGAM